MTDNPILRAVEALLFVADRPLDRDTLKALLDDVEEPVLEDALTTLSARYHGTSSGIELVEVRGGFQLRTAADLSDVVRRLFEKPPLRLSRAALETLSVIAYRQPLSKAEIDTVRGVDSGGVIRRLLEHELIAVVGRKEGPGRSLLYATADRFLELFGMRSLEELPRLSELEELEERHVIAPTEVPEIGDGTNEGT